MMAEIAITTSELSADDRRDHITTRLGFHRMDHKVDPGLYRLGDPDKSSPVFVTANYRLSFDALRTNLKGVSCYLLVLDTKGINVWCAAGKGTFGTDEIEERVNRTDLAGVVDHRRLILPQLGAPGVCAHEVRRRTGFSVEYGPVRAEDLPGYIRDGKVSESMRQVRFTLKDRAVLVPVEMRISILWAVLASILAFVLSGWVGLWAVMITYLTGTVLFPILLPYIPVKAFSAKGFLLGIAVSLVFASAVLLGYGGEQGPDTWLQVVAWVLLMSPWVAYLALNFTGSSTFTSRTGVRKEIFRYIPVIAVTFIIGVVLTLILRMDAWGWL
jgi:hypothetical protein